VGDYACSYQRQSGRLYVSTGALFFYSNLFGFEKKICVKYDELVEITILRTTSLYLRTADDEEHVFRSFQDRDAVLEEIEKFYNVPSAECRLEEPELSSATKDEATCDDAIQTKSISKEKKQFFSDEKKLLHKDSVCSTGSLEYDLFDDTKKVASKGSWENVKVLAEKNLSDSAVSDFRLSFKSVEEFFDHFLSDDAMHPITLFHEDIIGDNNVAITKWKIDGSDDCCNEKKTYTRTLKFEHRSKMSVAQVTRSQTYRYYGSSACLRNITKLKGVPSADAFFVEDMWLIQSTDEGDLILNVRFRTHFSKSTMIKSIIESRSRAETLEWWRKYKSFLKSRIQIGPRDEKDQVSANDREENSEGEGAHAQEYNVNKWIRKLGSPSNTFFTMSFVLLLWALYRLLRRILILENVVDSLRRRVELLEIDNSESEAIIF